MGKVLARLRHISVDSFMGNILPGNVRIEFRNLMVRANDRVFEGTMPLKLSDIKPFTVPAFPQGHYEVSFIPERYRRKAIFASVPSNGVLEHDLEFFIHPDRARTRFPSFATLTSSPGLSDLFKVLSEAGVDEPEYNALSPKQKGSLFNLHAKMQAQEVATDTTTFPFVESISRTPRGTIRIEEERVFFRAKPDLPGQVEQAAGFGLASGTLHNSFSQGFTRGKSFKTREDMGSLQLTFASNPAGEVEVDAALDDHSGLMHAFDVIGHRLTGDKTHPFDIHQILMHFHHIHPGYALF